VSDLHGDRSLTVADRAFRFFRELVIWIGSFSMAKGAVDFLPVDCLRDHFITPLNEFAERTQIQVEILVFQTEVLLQPLHLLRKLEKGTPQPLHFLVGQ
jgi:hypothetical protein